MFYWLLFVFKYNIFRFLKLYFCLYSFFVFTDIIYSYLFICNYALYVFLFVDFFRRCKWFVYKHTDLCYQNNWPHSYTSPDDIAFNAATSLKVRASTQKKQQQQQQQPDPQRQRNDLVPFVRNRRNSECSTHRKRIKEDPKRTQFTLNWFKFHNS